MLTIKQVEALCWIVRLGTFEAAARKLHTSQAAITKRIRELEAACESPLFDRSGRRAHLTERGRELARAGEALLAQRDRMAIVATGPEHLAKRFHFGVTELTALTWLPQLVGAIRRRWPRVVLEPDVDSSASLHRRLAAHALDFIIVPKAIEDPRFASVPLGSVRNEWMCSPDYLPGDSPLALQDLARHVVLAQDDQSFTGRFFNRWIEAQGLSLSRTISSNSLIAQGGLAMAGLGITYLPRDYFADLVSEGSLRIIRTNPALPEVPYVAMFRPDEPDEFNGHVATLARECCDFSAAFGTIRRRQPGPATEALSGPSASTRPGPRSPRLPARTRGTRRG